MTFNISPTHQAILDSDKYRKITSAAVGTKLQGKGLSWWKHAPAPSEGSQNAAIQQGYGGSFLQLFFGLHIFPGFTETEHAIEAQSPWQSIQMELIVNLTKLQIQKKISGGNIGNTQIRVRALRAVCC